MPKEPTFGLGTYLKEKMMAIEKVVQHEYESYSKQFNKLRVKSLLRPVIQPRKFHAFCVGTPKSGTHSIASMLSNYRSYHEINDTYLISLTRKKLDGAIDPNQLKVLLAARDKHNWLEMDSAHYNATFVKELNQLFPEAKFVMTIRDCLSWLDSWFNHQLSRDVQAPDTIYGLARSNYYSRNFEYTKHDAFLEQHSLFPLRSYFKFWFEHNTKVIEQIEPSRLLMIKTKQISHSSQKLAEFLSIPEGSIVTERSHSFKAKAKHHVLSKIDSGYLRDCADEFCTSLNDQLFPEATISDSLRALQQE